MFKRCALKICLCIVNGLLEKRSEMTGLVASVQKSVEEELEFPFLVRSIRAELIDSKYVSKYQT